MTKSNTSNGTKVINSKCHKSRKKPQIWKFKNLKYDKTKKTQNVKKKKKIYKMAKVTRLKNSNCEKKFKLGQNSNTWIVTKKNEFEKKTLTKMLLNSIYFKLEKLL